MIKSNQTIEDYADCKNEHFKWSENSIEDYMMLKEAVKDLIEEVNALRAQVGPPP